MYKVWLEIESDEGEILHRYAISLSGTWHENLSDALAELKDALIEPTSYEVESLDTWIENEKFEEARRAEN